MSHRRYLPGLLGLLLLLGGCGDESAPTPPPQVAPQDGLAYDLDGGPMRSIPRPTQPPNVALVLLDAAPPDSPALTALRELGREGLLFPEAVTAAPERWPSLASALTALLPHAHAVNADGVVPAGYARMWTTGAEVFQRTLGYETVAVVPASWPGFADPLLQGLQTVLRGDDAAALLDAWAASAQARPGPRLVVCVLAAGADPAPSLAALRAALVRAGDKRPWLLAATALRAAALEPTAPIAQVLSAAALRVPLAILTPAGARGVRAGTLGLADLFPTLLDVIGVPPLSSVSGSSFAALLKADGPGRPGPFEWSGAPRRRVYGVHAGSKTYGVVHDVRAGTVLEHLFVDGANRGDAEGRLPDELHERAFAESVERARDRVWAGVQETNSLSAGGYDTQAQVVTSERPPALRTTPR